MREKKGQGRMPSILYAGLPKKKEKRRRKEHSMMIMMRKKGGMHAIIEDAEPIKPKRTQVSYARKRKKKSLRVIVRTQ